MASQRDDGEKGVEGAVEWIEVINDTGSGCESFHAAIPERLASRQIPEPESQSNKDTVSILRNFDCNTEVEPWGTPWVGTPSSGCGYRSRPFTIGEARQTDTEDAHSDTSVRSEDAKIVLIPTGTRGDPEDNWSSDPTVVTSGFSTWDGDTLSHLFKFLDGKMLLRCASVCRRWHDRIMQHEELTWQALCTREMRVTSAHVAGSWRAEYKRQKLLAAAWRSPSGYRVLKRQTGHRQPIVGFAVTADGNSAVSVGSDTVVEWDIRTGKQQSVKSVDEEVSCMSLDADSLLLGTARGAVKMIDVSTAFSLMWSGRGHEDEEGGVTACCITCKYAVTGGNKGILMVWNRLCGELIAVVRGHRDEIRVLEPALSYAASTTFWSLSFECDVRAWRCEPEVGLTMILHGHSDDVNCIAVIDNRVLTGSDDKSVRLWDADSGQVVHVLTGHEGEVYCVALGVNLSIAASGDSLSEVRLWDPQSGQPIAQLPIVHIGCVRSLLISKDTQRLVSAGDRRRIVVWDLTTNAYGHITLSRYVG